MKKYYVIKDNLAEVFLMPIAFHNDNEAMRWFQTVINDKKNDVIFENPQDYELYAIGTWDEKTGMLNGTLNKLVDGKAVRRNE